MATLRAAFKAVLSADATLTGLLPGGVFDADAIDTPSDGGWQWAPKSGLVLTAHAIIRWGESLPSGPYSISGERSGVVIYCYHDSSYAVLEQIISRIKVLLHDAYISADDRLLAHCMFAGASGDMAATEYQRRPSRFIRFQINEVR